MRALVCHAPLDLRLDAFADEAMGPQQMRVRVAFGGICGSDLHYFQHGGFGTVRIKEPMVLGHEVAGSIEELGSAVKGFRKTMSEDSDAPKPNDGTESNKSADSTAKDK